MPQTHSIQASRLHGGDLNCKYVFIPDECPICHTGIVPVRFSAALSGTLDSAESRLFIFYRCTRYECEAPFIGEYVYGEGNKAYVLLNTAPKSPRKPVVPDVIHTLSPDFEKIYSQALAAEAFGLDEVTGIALRKALEFLIKDFSINQHPTERQAIEINALAKCIADYCGDAQLKATAERATWLGNDETHYMRKWVNQDITDLKMLIKLSVNHIENVLMTQHYEQEMQRGNTSGATPPNP
jgi:hypothetical protein